MAPDQPKDVIFVYEPCYLAPKKGRDTHDFIELSAYLQGQRAEDGFFDSKVFTLEDLRRALTRAAAEIVKNLDDCILIMIEMAKTPLCSTKIEPVEMLMEWRNIEWTDFGPKKVGLMGRQEVVEYLQVARKEIIYLKEEVFRLRRHLSINQLMKVEGWRESFTYIPTQRDDAILEKSSIDQEVENEQDANDADSEASTIRLFDSPSDNSRVKQEEDAEEFDETNIDPRLKEE